MGDAFIVRHGGNPLSNAYAIIFATFPAGSACTCTKGSTTLCADNTYGAWAFGVPEAGTWTVSCTNGTKTKSQNVVISRQYQAENVSLVYELVLFDGGSGGVDWTAISQRPTAVANENIVVAAQDSSNNVVSGIGTTSAVSLQIGIYRTLNFDVTSVTGSRGGLSLSNSRTNNVSGMGNKESSAVAWIRAAAGIVSLDVSNCTGDYFVVIGTGGYARAEVVVRRVWLE